MFVNFNKTFKEKTQTRLTVPPTLLKHLSDNLPEGLVYTLDKDGLCVITSEKEQLRIGGFVPAPTSRQIEVLGKNYTFDSAIKYLYNSQQSMPLKLKRDGFITINDQEFPIDKVKYNFYNPIKYQSGSFIMSPPPFPEPFPIRIGCKEYTREVTVTRVPNNSVSLQVYESDKNAPLYIRYTFDEKTDAIEFSISFRFSSNITVQDIIESASIYNAFLAGNGYLLGEPLNGKITDNSANKYDEKAIVFWKKVLQIERTLNMQFHPNKSEVDYETIYFVELLYQNLMENKPAIMNQNIDEISGHWKKTDFQDSIGKPIYFEFVSPLEKKLFDCDLSLPCLWGIMNAVLKDVRNRNKESVITLSDRDSDRPTYTAVICFKSKDDLDRYKKQEHSVIIQNFKDAINPNSFIVT